MPGWESCAGDGGRSLRAWSHVEGVGKWRSRSTMSSVWRGPGSQPWGHRPEKYCCLCQLLKYPQGTQLQAAHIHKRCLHSHHTPPGSTVRANTHLQRVLSEQHTPTIEMVQPTHSHRIIVKATTNHGRHHCCQHLSGDTATALYIQW